MAAREHDPAAIVLDNRLHGHRLEIWAAAFLRRIHAHVRVVGGIHAGSVADHHNAGVGYDIEADGLYYEIKSCRETIRRGNVKSRKQPGRWKIDAQYHAQLEHDRARRTMYFMLVRRGRNVARAYLTSHAVMTRILREHRTTSRFVTLPHHIVSQDLLLIHGAPAR